MYTATLGLTTAVAAVIGVVFNIAALSSAGGLVVVAIVIGLLLDTERAKRNR